MTKFEKIAATNIRNCFNFEIGGMYNAYLDGEENFPTVNEAKEIVYTLSINNRYFMGGYDGNAPREMRFAGKEFCINYIDKLFETDPDVAEIPWKEEE